jgi:lipopolysaccharide/colanic/teichoic acid biosynthesis glycosyltransferase
MGDKHGSLAMTDAAQITPFVGQVEESRGLHVVVEAPRETVPTRTARENAYQRIVKPALDFLGSLVLLVVVAPLLMLLAFAVRLTMGGPVFLRQERVGREGRNFRVWKFRTMLPDRRLRVVPISGPDRRVCHKTEDDPRITPVGRFLRKWSFDELPQLINVVAGDMSFVGPRPELPFIVAEYEPWQHRRHEVRPGITGLWQVSLRGDVLMHEATHIDLEYVDRLSFRTDMTILIKTPFAALGSCRGF